MICDPTTRLTLVTLPEDEPVTLVEAKTFLRIEHTADDEAITRAITAAREAAEQYLRIAFLPQEWRFTTAVPTASLLRMPVGPVQNIDVIAVTDSAGEESEVDEDSYRLTLDGYGVIFETLPSGESLAIDLSVSLAPSAEAVPALIKQGILHHVTAMLAQREGFVPLPISSIGCYQPFRRILL